MEVVPADAKMHWKEDVVMVKQTMLTKMHIQTGFASVLEVEPELDWETGISFVDVRMDPIKENGQEINKYLQLHSKIQKTSLTAQRLKNLQ